MLKKRMNDAIENNYFSFGNNIILPLPALFSAAAERDYKLILHVFIIRVSFPFDFH